MGRYSSYIQDVWKLQANRKVLGLVLFGVIFDNSKAFSPGQQLVMVDGVTDALQMLIQKGYDFLIIQGQPPLKSKNLEIIDFENILGAAREIIQQLGGRVKNAYYAPGIDKNDPYVKPNTGMFDRAQAENMVKWEGTYFVGAESNDVKASAKVKAIPVLITSGKETKIKAFEMTNQLKVKEFSTLLDFAKSL